MTLKLAQAAAGLAAASAIGAGSFAVMSPLDRPPVNAGAAGFGAGQPTAAASRADIRKAVLRASKLAPGEVTAGSIARGAVGTDAIANGAVTSEKVENGSLTAADFADGQLPAGHDGAQGVQGLAGIDGAAGPQGLQGLTGPQGARGAEGPQGLQGLAGPQGATGPQGSRGAEGPAGPQGLTGAQGPAGPQGPAGTPGPAGSSNAREVHRDADVNLPGATDVTLATMSNVPAGSYVVIAKTVIVQLSGGAGGAPPMTCTLDAGNGNTDTAETHLKASLATLHLELVASLPAPGPIVLRCTRDTDPGTYVARETKIIALQVTSATSAAVTG